MRIRSQGLNPITEATDSTPTAEEVLERLGDWHPKQNFRLEYQNYTITLARNKSELLDAFRLRHEAFFGNAAIEARGTGIDQDEFDSRADHLLVLDSRGRVLGTYRVLCSLYTDRFYSSTEFDLSNILAADGIKLELGRAATHPDIRGGIGVALLFKGLCAYAKQVQAHYFFGCSSIPISACSDLSRLHAWLCASHLAPATLRAAPLQPALRNPLLRGEGPTDSLEGPSATLPPLLRLYLAAGAHVCGEPAWDPLFETVDYLTLMDLGAVQPSYRRRFLDS